MGRCIALTFGLLGVVGGLAFYLGLFDRPPFVFYESIIDGQDEVFAVMAFTKTPDIGGHIGRMLQDTKGLLDEIPAAKAAMRSGASLYGVPDDVVALACGLYFDNPSVVPSPRWGVGWIISAPSLDEVEKLRSAVAAFYEGEEEIRKVRIGLHGPGLRARIPWRTMITPMIAPMIHWNRAHTYLAEGGHKAISNEYGESIDSCVFSEIYVSNEDDSTQYFIDYIALLGDTTNIWEDSFPTSNSSTNGNNAIFSSSEIKYDDISSHDESVGESSSEL